MKRIILFFIAVFLGTGACFSQQIVDINKYKYVIIPKQFSSLNKPDQHQTSSLTKFLFNKNGYTAFLSDEILPVEVAKNRCLALDVDLKNNSNLFTTKNVLVLKDCYGKVIFTSKEGTSRDKNYKRAYHEAIRKAFKSIEALNYKYIPVEESISELKKINTPVIVEGTKEKSDDKNKNTKTVLYAQSIQNGFQLVNTKPEVVFKALQTNVKNVYILKGKNGILYKNNSDWIVEYYNRGKKITRKYLIKF